jgi:hypothetical protein
MTTLPILCVIYSDQCGHCNKYKDGSALLVVRQDPRIRGIVMIEKNDHDADHFDFDYFPTVFLQFTSKSIRFESGGDLDAWLDIVL